MKKLLFSTLCMLLLLSCNKKTEPVSSDTATSEAYKQNLKTEQKQNPADFVPKGYVISEKIYGDLNKDGIEDCVLIIKDPNKKNIDEDEREHERRGIIVLFNKNGHYELAVKNYDCLPYGEVISLVPAELSIEIKNGNLYIIYEYRHYSEKYTFKFQNLDFELIGYDLDRKRKEFSIYSRSLN